MNIAKIEILDALVFFIVSPKEYMLRSNTSNEVLYLFSIIVFQLISTKLPSGFVGTSSIMKC
jgi:hypothetical protein